MRIGVDAIDNYLDIMNTKYAKNTIIIGFPSRDKIFITIYLVLHAYSYFFCFFLEPENVRGNSTTQTTVLLSCMLRK